MDHMYLWNKAYLGYSSSSLDKLNLLAHIQLLNRLNNSHEKNTKKVTKGKLACVTL